MSEIRSVGHHGEQRQVGDWRLRPRRAAGSFLRGVAEIGRRGGGRRVAAGCGWIALAALEVTGWLLGRVVCVVLVTIGLIAIGIGVFCRTAVVAPRIDDDRRLETEQSVAVWTRVLLVIAWALGRVPVDYTFLAPPPAGGPPAEGAAAASFVGGPLRRQVSEVLVR